MIGLLQGAQKLTQAGRERLQFVAPQTIDLGAKTRFTQHIWTGAVF
jgi:hypothetical protein